MHQSHLYSTRLQKGGALLEQMRQLTLEWCDEPNYAATMLAENPLALASKARARDVVTRAFVPRFVKGQWPRLWKALAVLESYAAGQENIVPIHYLATAVSEPLLQDFVCDYLYPRYNSSSGQLTVTTSDVISFIESQPNERFDSGNWTKTVQQKVGRGLLAALRDFGLLEGHQTKKVVPYRLNLISFAFIAFMLYQRYGSGNGVLSAREWKLFLFDTEIVERFFFDAHDRNLLKYNAAGSTIRIEFPVDTLEDYAHVILQRSA